MMNLLSSVEYPFINLLSTMHRSKYIQCLQRASQSDCIHKITQKFLRHMQTPTSPIPRVRTSESFCSYSPRSLSNASFSSPLVREHQQHSPLHLTFEQMHQDDGDSSRKVPMIRIPPRLPWEDGGHSSAWGCVPSVEREWVTIYKLENLTHYSCVYRNKKIQKMEFLEKHRHFHNDLEIRIYFEDGSEHTFEASYISDPHDALMRFLCHFQDREIEIDESKRSLNYIPVYVQGDFWLNKYDPTHSGMHAKYSQVIYPIFIRHFQENVQKYTRIQDVYKILFLFSGKGHLEEKIFQSFLAMTSHLKLQVTLVDMISEKFAQRRLARFASEKIQFRILRHDIFKMQKEHLGEIYDDIYVCGGGFHDSIGTNSLAKQLLRYLIRPVLSTKGFLYTSGLTPFVVNKQDFASEGFFVISCLDKNSRYPFYKIKLM